LESFDSRVSEIVSETVPDNVVHDLFGDSSSTMVSSDENENIKEPKIDVNKEIIQITTEISEEDNTTLMPEFLDKSEVHSEPEAVEIDSEIATTTIAPEAPELVSFDSRVSEIMSETVPDNVVHDLFGTSFSTNITSAENESINMNIHTESELVSEVVPESLGNVMEEAENEMHENDENTIPTDPEQLSNKAQEMLSAKPEILQNESEIIEDIEEKVVTEISVEPEVVDTISSKIDSKYISTTIMPGLIVDLQSNNREERKSNFNSENDSEINNFPQEIDSKISQTNSTLDTDKDQNAIPNDSEQLPDMVPEMLTTHI